MKTESKPDVVRMEYHLINCRFTLKRLREIERLRRLFSSDGCPPLAEGQLLEGIDSPHVNLRFSVNGRRIWSWCSICDLIDMFLKDGDYTPFVCSSCGDSDCAGIREMIHVSHPCGNIVMRLPFPLHQTETFRTFHFSRLNYVEQLISVIDTRIALERISGLCGNTVPDGKRENQEFAEKAADLFGFHDASNCHFTVSRYIREQRSVLIRAFSECSGPLIPAGTKRKISR